MEKFVKKPIIVEAEQWFPGKKVEGVKDEIGGASVRPYVVTAHKQMAILEPGDWVISEPDGRGYYPCKDDIFRKTYDPVTE
jgi:hypothetical protein